MSTTSQPTLPATSETAQPESKAVSLPAIRRSDRGLMLQTYDEAVRFSRVVVASGLAPKSFDTPEKVFVAMQYGAEIGLAPMQSLQSIAVIGNRPSLWGDALIAKVESSGLCEDRREWKEGEYPNDDFTYHFEIKRVGRKTPFHGEFSIADAKIAKLWGKVGKYGDPTPWVLYPKRMLRARAVGFAIRDGFADVLCGFACAEEMLDVTGEYEAPQRRVIEQANDANYCALVSTLSGKCGCKTPDDNDEVIRLVSRHGGLDCIKEDEAACGEVLKALEGRHESVMAEVEQHRREAA